MKIQTSRSASFVKRIFAEIPDYISGTKNDTHNIGKVFWASLTRYLLDKIHEAYAIKSEGGTDELGNQWPPLKPETIARRPIGRGNLGGLGLTKKATGLKLSDRQRGLLSPEENRAWKRKYSIVLAHLQKRLGSDRAKKIAASTAWNYIKGNGAKTKKALLGSRQALIMRVTDSIFKSLEPTNGSGFQYRPRKNQLYNLINGKLELGTTVNYAKFHNKSRPVVPDNIEPWVKEAQNFAMEKVKEHILGRVL